MRAYTDERLSGGLPRSNSIYNANNGHWTLHIVIAYVITQSWWVYEEIYMRNITKDLNAPIGKNTFSVDITLLLHLFKYALPKYEWAIFEVIMKNTLLKRNSGKQNKINLAFLNDISTYFNFMLLNRLLFSRYSMGRATIGPLDSRVCCWVRTFGAIYSQLYPEEYWPNG